MDAFDMTNGGQIRAGGFNDYDIFTSTGPESATAKALLALTPPLRRRRWGFVGKNGAL